MLVALKETGEFFIGVFLTLLGIPCEYNNFAERRKAEAEKADQAKREGNEGFMYSGMPNSSVGTNRAVYNNTIGRR